MFMLCSDRATIAESAILACCPALNSPVVNVEALDVGTAKAAILLSADEYGELTLRIRVQLVSSGTGVTFRYQGNAADFGNGNAALEAARRYAEGMGFLFDEDIMRDGTGSSRRRAFKLWNAMVGPSGPGAEASPLSLGNASTSGSAVSLQHETLPELLLDLDADGSDTSVSSTPVLTKHRPRPDSAPPHARARKIRPPSPTAAIRTSREPAGEGELARIALASEELGNEYVDVSGFLTRLLGSF